MSPTLSAAPDPTGRATALAAFLRDAPAFRFAAADCALRLADWIVACGWPDPAADLRGAYDGALGAARVLRRAGGLAALLDARLPAAGLSRPAGAIPVGAVAAIGDRSRLFHCWGAIYDGECWRVHTERGGVRLSARPLTVWSV